MGIVNGQPLAYQDSILPSRSVVLKLRGGLASELIGIPVGKWPLFMQLTLPDELVDVMARPVVGPELIRRLEETKPAGRWGRLNQFLMLEVPEPLDPEGVAATFRAGRQVESAEVDPGPVPPPVHSSDDPRCVDQRYLDAAPTGIDARFAWGVTDGAGVGFVDLEQGWTLNHDDLVAAGITLISGVNRAWFSHGTSVLGEVVGVDNTIGVVGIAPQATARVVSEWRTNTTYSTADAIASAVSVMAVGDVLLLESQTTYPSVPGREVPVEVYAVTQTAIRAAVDSGIIVVEAGANGGVDLDTFKNLAGKTILNRGSADFVDSGAIMVGAASAAVPHARLSFSSRGSRIDCYGWGESITTTSSNATGTSTNSYTDSFGGTSGASPIIAGAALLLQSYARARGTVISPATMRTRLSDPLANTPSSNPTVDRIGVMPNLKKLLQAEADPGIAGVADRWHLIAQILFGVTTDGGGVVVLPGTGPVPIDPWNPLIPESMSPQVRDILVALATYELAGLCQDAANVHLIRQASLSAVENATAQLTSNG